MEGQGDQWSVKWMKNDKVSEEVSRTGANMRQLVKNILQGQEDVALGFIDLVKAYDMALMEITLAKLGLMGVPVVKVKMVTGSYEETKGNIR